MQNYDSLEDENNSVDQKEEEVRSVAKFTAPPSTPIGQRSFLPTGECHT